MMKNYEITCTNGFYSVRIFRVKNGFDCEIYSPNNKFVRTERYRDASSKWTLDEVKRSMHDDIFKLDERYLRKLIRNV